MLREEENIYPKGEVKQSEDFEEGQELLFWAYQTLIELLESQTEKSFKDKGIEKTKNYAGVYGNGKPYGFGVHEGKYNVFIQDKNSSYIEKTTIFGTKKVHSIISLDIDTSAKQLNLEYNTTEQAVFRGYRNEDGPYMVNINEVVDLSSKDKAKKELKKIIEKATKQEVAYLLNTKIGIEDKTGKSIDGSTVEENINMKKLSIVDIINSSSEDVFNLFESKKDKNKKEKVKKNPPEVISQNTQGRLLFDDLEEIEDKEYRSFIKKTMKNKFGTSKLGELKPSEKRELFNYADLEWKSKNEKGLDEITSAGSYAAGAIGGENIGGNMGTAGQFKYAANPFEKFKDTTYYANKIDKRPKVKKTKNEGESFWTSVDIEPLKKNHIAGAPGMMGVEVNSAQEEEMSTTRNRYSSKKKGKKKKKINESLNLIKRKIVSGVENESKGINKRYIITHKLNEQEEKDRWRRLSTFKTYETIKEAENLIGKTYYYQYDEVIDDIASILNERKEVVYQLDASINNPDDILEVLVNEGIMKEKDSLIISECGCEDIEFEDIEAVTRDEYEDEASREFEYINGENIDNGDEVEGKVVIVVPKPNSNIKYKVFEDDFLNENKFYIYDFTTSNYVPNPNHKSIRNEGVKKYISSRKDLSEEKGSFKINYKSLKDLENL